MKFDIGDKVVAVRDIQFSDDSWHKKGQEIMVTASTVSYFQACAKDYVFADGYGLADKRV